MISVKWDLSFYYQSSRLCLSEVYSNECWEYSMGLVGKAIRRVKVFASSIVERVRNPS